MKKTIASVMPGLALLTVMFMVTPVRALPPPAQQCPDTCIDGTCSNNADVTCTTDVQCVGAAVAAACPCDTATNHGQHQRCVVHLRNQLRRQGCPVTSIARCSARSTCGKPGRVLCCSVTGTGTCDTQTDGSLACSNDSTKTCTTDADCTTLSGPRLKRTAAACTDRGGYSSGTGSICAGCQPPVACCVPSSTVGQPGTCEILTDADCAAANGTASAGAAPTCTGVTCP
jgi:hypothetical protein